jgi:predicted nucleic acid-binding protein
LNPTSLTIDASVAIKWFNKEPYREEALKIRAAHMDGTTTIHAPTLLVYEVCNALKHNPDYDEKSLTLALDALHKIRINLKNPNRDQMANTVKYAYLYGLSAYDASYLACAEAAGNNLITADEKLHGKAKENRRVILLPEYKENK